MPTLLFTRPARNRIYKAIAASALDPAECDLKQDALNASIEHRSGALLQFSVHPSDAKYLIVHSFIDDFEDMTYAIENQTAKVPEVVTRWANIIKEAIETPDLWAELQRNQEVISSVQSTDSGNAPFTQDEQRLIAAQLQEIRTQVKKQFELTGEQIADLDEKLDEAVEATKRMGRKDWFIYFLGTISALTIAATVAPGIGEHIFTMFIHALGYLFTGGSEPPEIPPTILS